MSKQVSSLLFRIHKFNNYKNIWIFSYNKKLNILLKQYYKISRFFYNMLLDVKIFYFNNIYQIYGKINIKNLSYKFIKNFIIRYNIFTKFNLFFILYKLNISLISIQLLKLFIKVNLLKYKSIQNLYNLLYINILTKYLNDTTHFLNFKIIISGRINNTKLATSEIFQFGSLPLQKIDILILYEKFYLLTKYGILGIKIWIGKKYT